MIKKLLNSKFKKDLSFSYIAQAITVSFGFLQLFLINRYFGIETFGQLAIIMSTAGIFSSLLTARSSEAVTRFFKREELNKNYENAKFILFVGFSIDFITAILLVILIYLMSSFIANHFLKDIKLQDEIIIYSFISFVMFLRGSMMGYLQSKEMFVNINIISIVESVSKILFLILFIFVIHKIELKVIIYSFLLASIVSFFYTFYIFFKNYIKEFSNINLKIDKLLLKEYWSFNVKTFFSSSLKAGNQNVDNLIIGYFLNVEIVGVYQIIKKILSPLSTIIAPFSTLYYPKLIVMFEEKSFQTLKKTLLNVSIRLFIISIFYIGIFYLLLEQIFLIMNIAYKFEYNLYYLLISIISLFPSFLWWSRIFSNTVNPNYSIVMGLFSTLYILSISIILTYYYGMFGYLYSYILLLSLRSFYWIKKLKSI